MNRYFGKHANEKNFKVRLSTRGQKYAPSSLLKSNIN